MDWIVAQICNLPYRRIEFGRASDRSHTPANPSRAMFTRQAHGPVGGTRTGAADAAALPTRQVDNRAALPKNSRDNDALSNIYISIHRATASCGNRLPRHELKRMLKHEHTHSLPAHDRGATKISSVPTARHSRCRPART